MKLFIVKQILLLLRPAKTMKALVSLPNGSDTFCQAATDTWTTLRIPLALYTDPMGNIVAGLAFESLWQLNSSQIIIKAAINSKIEIKNLEILIDLAVYDGTAIVPLGWKDFAHFESVGAPSAVSQFVSSGGVRI